MNLNDLIHKRQRVLRTIYSVYADLNLCSYFRFSTQSAIFFSRLLPAVVLFLIVMAQVIIQKTNIVSTIR